MKIIIALQSDLPFVSSDHETCITEIENGSTDFI